MLLNIALTMALSYLLYKQTRIALLARTSYLWPRVQAKIIESNFTDFGQQYAFNLAYEYLVHGKPYTSKQISLNPFAIPGKTLHTKKQVLVHVAEYPLGNELTVYYNPDDPRQAIVKHRPFSHYALAIIVTTVVTALQLYFMLA